MRASNQSWPQMIKSGDFRGQWVALDNCRYDPCSSQPVEGDVVDSDQDLAELCARLQKQSRSKCTIMFCDDQVIMEPTETADFELSEEKGSAA